MNSSSTGDKFKNWCTAFILAAGLTVSTWAHGSVRQIDRVNSAVTTTLEGAETPLVTRPELRLIKEHVQDNPTTWAAVISFAAKNRWFFDANPTVVIIGGRIGAKNGELVNIILSNPHAHEGLIEFDTIGDYQPYLLSLSSWIQGITQAKEILARLYDENPLLDPGTIGIHTDVEKNRTLVQLSSQYRGVVVKGKSAKEITGRKVIWKIFLDLPVEPQVRAFYDRLKKEIARVRK